MSAPESAGTTIDGLVAVSQLVRDGILWIDLDGVWLAPEVTMTGDKILLQIDVTSALDESE
jgi:hypothetical protein